jgi:hypothetical protein
MTLSDLDVGGYSTMLESARKSHDSALIPLPVYPSLQVVERLEKGRLLVSCLDGRLGVRITDMDNDMILA